MLALQIEERSSPMADKRNLCAMIPADLHARIRQEQERTGKTLSEYVEQLITDYYKMKEGTKMTGDTRTLAVQIPEELFLRLDAYLKRSGIKSKKQFLISLIEAALAEGEAEGAAEQPEDENDEQAEDGPETETDDEQTTEAPAEPDTDTGEEE